MLLLTPLITFGQQEEEEEFYRFEGKRIRSIYITLLDIAGADIIEGKKKDTSWLGKLANTFHAKTKEWVVRERLLFKEGDLIEPKVLSESERLLRTSGPFTDARIYIPSDSSNTDSVDVYVITKDKWTLALLASYNADTRNSYFGLKDDNLLGFGHKADLKVSHDQDVSIGMGADLKYTAPNVMGTYTDVKLDIITNRKTKMQAIGFSRTFLSTETDWAGGADFSFFKSSLDFYGSDSAAVLIPFKSSSQDLWVGKSFHPGFGPAYFTRNSKFVTSIRLLNKSFTDRPHVTSSSNRIFEKSVLFLAGAGFINQRFYKDMYIKSFGITEDVPVGGLILFTGGFDKGEFFDRNYMSVEGIFSRRIEDFGYISAKVAAGGFRNKNKWEQNVVNINLIYHSQLYKAGRWVFRGFLQNDITLGYNRFNGENIYLSTDTGLRGISNYILYGTKREVLNLEARAIYPHSWLGFVFGASAFADVGLIGGRDRSLLSNKLYQGYGVSLRTRNESIARADLEIAFIYNPFQPETGKGLFSVLLKSSIVLGIREFIIGKPILLEFGDR